MVETVTWHFFWSMESCPREEKMWKIIFWRISVVLPVLPVNSLAYVTRLHLCGSICIYIELHCRQFNIASQYVAGIDLHFSGLHWCIVFFVSFWLALYGRVPGLSCPSSQLYIWGSCYPRVTHTIIHHIRYPTQNYRFLENLFYEIRLWNIWDLVKPTLVVSANPIYIWYLTIGSLFKERRGRRIAKLRHQHNYGNLAPTLWRPAQCWFKQGVWV